VSRHRIAHPVSRAKASEHPFVKILFQTYGISHFEQNGHKLLAAAGCEEALLLADLYPGAIRLAIANLPDGDSSRDWLAQQLAAIRPAIRVRLLSGYVEPRQSAAGQACEPAAERHLTKWDLLEWARESCAAAGTE